ncbi:MAG TPA: hypothetical protein VIH34_00920 [Candidatus Bathyarchaeia archaeon]
MNKSDSQSILVQAVLLVILVALASSLYLIPLETVSTDGAVNTKTFTLIAENWGYNQTQGGPVLRAEQGDNITIAFIVPGELAHNLRIRDYGILIGGEFGLRRGQNQTISFIADKPGVFEYDCRTAIYGGHAELGMRGVFIVTQPEEE